MDQLRICITGSNGFVAQKFTEILSQYTRPFEMLGISKSVNRNPYLTEQQFIQVDLLDQHKISEILADFKPTHILHTAAITSVEACENDKILAQQINVHVTKQLADYAAANNCHITFLSTDFVFDGKTGPYAESDQINPVNEYGHTKVLAEQYLLNSSCKSAILRTILVYGAIPDTSRSNLVLWAKKQLENQQAIKVVADQWRMPTWVDDLAKACLSAMEKCADGVFHISGNEMMTIEEAVYMIADEYNLDRRLISAISAREIGQADNRPQKTGFVLEKSSSVLNFIPTPFVVSLQEINKQLHYYSCNQN